MITETYKKAMEIGHIMKTTDMFNDGSIPDEWTDNVEIAHLVRRINVEVTEESVKAAVTALKTELEQNPDMVLNDLDWKDEVRGIIAGTRFGAPNDSSLALANEAETIWDGDVKGVYGYYHEVCDMLTA